MVIIGLLFGLCVAMLIGLALMTGASYNDVSVVINIFVEPLLCLLIAVPALLAILGKGQNAVIAFSSCLSDNAPVKALFGAVYLCLCGARWESAPTFAHFMFAHYPCVFHCLRR